MERWMIVYLLPLEVWMDIFVFPWISRQAFGQLVDRIGNFKFVEHAQFYLHEWGKRKLDEIQFDEDKFYKHVYGYNGDLVFIYHLRLDVPQTPVPENIKSFDRITIDHFDAQTMHFFRQIRPLLNAPLKISAYAEPTNLENLRTILTNLAPLLLGSGTRCRRALWWLRCYDGHAFLVARQCLREQLAQLKVLKIDLDETEAEKLLDVVNSIVDWLTNNDNQQQGPRLCVVASSDGNTYEQISRAIRQHFLAAKTSSTFAVHICDVWVPGQLSEIHLKNGLGEELHGTWTGPKTLRITRHRADGGTELQEWIGANTNKWRSHSRIKIWNPTVGNFHKNEVRELAVLPLVVWADIFLSEYNWISRQELAEFANKMKNRQFANKLDKLLHGCGQHTLRSLQISSKPWNYKFRASLEVTPTRDRWFKYSEFPEMEMPENIKSFEFFSIRYFDDEVLGFLTKIKPLFTNVYFQMLQSSEQETECVRILLTHLLPMVAGIRGICCTNDGVELLEQHFPGTLALAKELHLETMNFLDDNNKPVSILAYLNWLDAPQDFDVHGPRFLKMFTDSNTITAMVNDVRQNFLAATTTSTFVIFLEFDFYKSQFRAEEQTTKNAATNEQLTVRNAIYEMPYGYQIHYVEIMRHPIGANSEAKMREWIEQRAFYEKPYCNYEQQVIWIGGASLTIGHITKNADGVNQAEDEPADDAGDEAGPSTSAKGMKKK